MADIVPPTTPIRGTWGDPVEQEQQKCRDRRRRVLAHPDIAIRLTHPPMRYPSPEMWTGFIPPALISSGAGDKPNKSPIRKQLIAIVQAVADREAAESPVEGEAS